MKIEEINNYFKLPIYYNKNKIKLKENIIEDLELIKTCDPSNQNIYSYYFNNNNNNELSTNIIHQISNFYTTDVNFIKDNQKLLKNFQHDNDIYKTYSDNYNKIIDCWNEIKNDNGFKEKYYYINLSWCEFLNNSDLFLHFMSIYNMISPVLSLLVPIIILIIPFFIIKFKGIQLTIDEYINILTNVIQHNAIGKLFTNFNKVTLQEKAYLIVSATFYLFSIYQNFLVCYRFNENIIKIHNYLNEFKIYLEHTIHSMEKYLDFSKQLNTHNEFNIVMTNELENLKELYTNISKISELKYNFKKTFEIGHILKTFYQIYDKPSYNQSIMYSLGFHGYIDCIKGLQNNIVEKKINLSQLTTKKSFKNTTNLFKNNYYACLKDTKHIKNNINLNKNIIISGPNASGKTTIIKSVLINIILTQQFGCGFYESAKLKPYKHLHCYLNIPDTSGRDSLFQAEARRCKEIIELINENPNDEHFCAFDELYSGTNPEEATISAISFMKYIIKKKNIN